MGRIVVDVMLKPEILDDGVGQEGLGGLAGLREVGLGDVAVDGQHEALALPHVGELVDPEPGQRPPDRLALGVEDLGLEHDVDDDASHRVSPGAKGVVRSRV